MLFATLLKPVYMPKRRLPMWFTLCLLTFLTSFSIHASTLESATQAYEIGRLSDARAALDDVLSTAEPASETFRIADHNLAVLKARQGDLDGAIAKFEATIAAHPVAAAAFENVKALRAVQAARSLNKALGESDEPATPALRWLISKHTASPKETAASPTELAAIADFVSDYGRALGDRDTAGFLGLYTPAYAPPNGNSRAAWQLEVLGAFADTPRYSPRVELVQAHRVNDTLTVVAFSLHDPRSDTQRVRNVLLQRDASNQWKILSDL